MADRPVFIPFGEGQRLVREVSVEFHWHPGLAPVQKRKNIVALHEAASRKGIAPLLEVSTKSPDKLGEHLSAFNLGVLLEDGTTIPLECAFQGSKVFSQGGPYTDLYRVTSREAKLDRRLRSSGPIVGFSFGGIAFPSEPKTAFYDWLYTRALAPHQEFLQRLRAFAGFTDIEFNPAKSINCQARSCALFVSLSRKSLVESVADSPQRFLETVAADSAAQPHSANARQNKLL